MAGWTVVAPRSKDMAVHAVLLPGGQHGKVLYFGGYRVDDTHLFDVAPPYNDDTITDIEANESPNYNIFCAGHAFLSDGRVLVAGGQLHLFDPNGIEIPAPDRDMPGNIEHGVHGGMAWGGERRSSIFSPLAASWREITPMSLDPAGNPDSGGRWYPTLTTLANGQVLCVGGHPDLREEYPSADHDEIRHSNNTPERYVPASDDWVLLTDVPPDENQKTSTDPAWDFDYQRTHLLPNGEVFFASPVRGRNRTYNPWTGAFLDDYALTGDSRYHGISAAWTSVMLPLLHNEGYRARVMVMGGVDAEIIDFGTQNPAWQETSDNRQWDGTPPIRAFVCPVILPDGRIFFSGGCEDNSDPDPDNPPNLDQIREASTVKAAEIYDPQINWNNGTYGSGEWSTVESAEAGRHYHSVALLLPNGTVWTAGSNGPSPEGGGRELRIEVYSPDYTDMDGRPTIQDSPDTVGYGLAFDVTTNQAGSIARAALIRCGSCTHGFNPDQRYVSLRIESASGSTLRLRSPNNANAAPPGYYMLWIIDNQGRPCEWAPFIRLSSQKCFFTADVSTYSIHEVAALGTPAVFDNALYFVLESFLPSEAGTPNLSLSGPGGVNVPGISLELGSAQYESDPNVSDIAQRIAYPIRVTFNNDNAFDLVPNSQDFVNVTLSGEFGPFNCNVPLTLSLNPNPRMSDGNPHWLSIDLRVFKTHPGDTPTGGVEHGSGANAPYDYIQDLVAAYNAASSQGHPFDQLETGQEATRLALYSEEADGTPVYNYAVARVRFRAPEDIDAVDVRVFFRQWATGWSNLFYTAPGLSHGSYRRDGDGPGATPLLGINGGEITNIPCFAEPRTADMTAQTDSTNRRTLEGANAAEVHGYFGCWLDINQDVARFPLEPQGDGPFSGDLLSIQELMRGLHQCLVAEIHYTPDPIQTGATPASSDNLSQRNILLDDVDNPGGFSAHLAHHTFELKASPRGFPPPQLSVNSSAAVSARLHPDELAIHWGGLPRESIATLYFPQVDVEGVLAFAAQRGGPKVLRRAGSGAVSFKIGDVSYVPLPGPLEKDIASLLSIQLPPTVTKGQKFTVVVRQIDGRRRKVVGTTQFDIHVKTAPDIRPRFERDFSVLRHIQLSIPESNRWHPVFERYLGELAERIRAVGGDPDAVLPSPTGHPPRRDDGTDGDGDGDGEGKERSFMGKVAELHYDCFGAFEGFVLEDCRRRRAFESCDRGVEAVVRQACLDRATLRVEIDPKSKRGIKGIVLLCC